MSELLDRAASHTPGWCWMVHPSRNEGRPIPVLLATYEGADWYIPLDPMDATDFLWEERDPEWEMVRDPLAEARAATVNEELLSIARRWDALDAGAWHPTRWESDRVELLKDTRAAIAKATGAQS